MTIVIDRSIDWLLLLERYFKRRFSATERDESTASHGEIDLGKIAFLPCVKGATCSIGLICGLSQKRYFLDAGIAYFLSENQDLIPKEWRHGWKNNPTGIWFPGTTFTKKDDKKTYFLYLFWDDDGETWCLDLKCPESVWFAADVVAVLVAS